MGRAMLHLAIVFAEMERGLGSGADTGGVGAGQS